MGTSASKVAVGSGVWEGWEAGVLPGKRQTVYRSELYAVIRALQASRGPVRVATDCKGVAEVATKVIGGAPPPVLGLHADLWKDFAGLVRGRRVRVGWIPSHTDEDAVRQGAITREDRDGNQQADDRAKGAWALWGPMGLRQDRVRHLDLLVEGVLRVGADVLMDLRPEVQASLEERGEATRRARREPRPPRQGRLSLSRDGPLR